MDWASAGFTSSQVRPSTRRFTKVRVDRMFPGTESSTIASAALGAKCTGVDAPMTLRPRRSRRLGLEAFVHPALH